MKYEFYVKDSFGKNLEVVQEIPQKGDKFPTVVMVAGFGMDLSENGYYDQLSDILVRNGFQTIRFNFEGLGKSAGNFVDMTVEKQAQQLKDIIYYINKKDRFTNINKIGIFAHSFGVATTFVALPLPEIKTFVFTGTSVDPMDYLSRSFKRQRGFFPDAISKRERADNKITRIGPQFWINIKKYDFFELGSFIDIPVLLVHGEKDINTKPYQVEELFYLIKSKKRLDIIKKANHSLTGIFRAKALEIIKEWFVENLLN